MQTKLTRNIGIITKGVEAYMQRIKLANIEKKVTRVVPTTFPIT
jgi:hypothetical protein